MITKKDIKFNDLGLSETTLSSLVAIGYKAPTEVQAKSIPTLKSGTDLIAQANTGTGKTMAFAIPCVESIDKGNKNVQALILCPTRELTVQVANEIKKLTQDQKVFVAAIYGGQEIKVQLQALKRGVHIVVGTPGRIKDHLQRGSLKLSSAKYVVLDEADQMLNMGFATELKAIMSKTPQSRQTIMFSATLPKELMSLAKSYQKNAKHINLVAQKSLQNTHIKQFCFNIKPSEKDSCIETLLNEYKIFSGIIFCNTKRKVDELTKILLKKNFLAASIHGDIKQRKRDQVMKNFRKGSIEILIATDLASRGIDVSNLEAVINYDLPKFDEDYIHRIGRTGRAGKSGFAFNLITKNDSNNMRRIAKKHKLKLEYAVQRP